MGFASPFSLVQDRMEELLEFQGIKGFFPLELALWWGQCGIHCVDLNKNQAICHEDGDFF